LILLRPAELRHYSGTFSGVVSKFKIVVRIGGASSGEGS
jgi:hypothetical protein